MQRSLRVGSQLASQLAALASVVALAALMSGCPARGIGDPCVPEAIPGGGFDDREIYVETSSVQCRTRTCMVFKLSGNPTHIDGETPGCAGVPHPMGITFDDCINRDATVDVNNSDERVFCSCRCSAAGGDTNTPLCECTDGFHCVDVLNAGGVGVRGGYCVPNELCTSDDDCPSGCNLERGVCNVASE